MILHKMAKEDFRLHLGTINHGCVTVDNSIKNGNKDWSLINKMLQLTQKTKVTYEEPWYSPNKTITKYGELTIHD